MGNQSAKGLEEEAVAAPKQAAGQEFAYSLQSKRMLVRLLQAYPGETVSMEAFEDVGVRAADGSSIAEQDASYITSNPIGDRSEKLWKTFSNWVNAVRAGTLSVQNTKFVLYVLQNREGGSIIQSFANARSDEDAKVALATAKTLLIAPLPTTLASYANNLFDHNDIAAAIISRFFLEIGTGDPFDDIRLELQRSSVRDEIIDDVMNALLGHVHRAVSDQVKNDGKPASITKSDFSRIYNSVTQRYSSQSYLPNYAPKPSEDAILATIKDEKSLFIWQLSIINSGDMNYGAASDYIQASTERALWAEKEGLLEEDFDAFESSLERDWTNKRRIIELRERGKLDEDRGRSLLLECLELRRILGGREVQDFFIPGCLHTLANVLKIGWHPDYENKASEEGLK
jgi:hypothetical protein